MGVSAETATSFEGCRQVSRCDSLSLRASHDTICQGSTLLLTAGKNRECGIMPLFTYDPDAVQSFVQVSDSTYAVRFTGSWQGKIYSTIKGCGLLTDSVAVVAVQAPDTLDLGSDTSICPGNTVLLQAPVGFIAYRWQFKINDRRLA